MPSISEELDAISASLKNIEGQETAAFKSSIGSLVSVTSEIDKSWCHSWLGYHSCVYYEGFQSPPAGAIFSSEWGFEELYAIPGTTGDWTIYKYDDVIQYIFKKASNPNTTMIDKVSSEVKLKFEEFQENIISCISIYLSKNEDDFVNQKLDIIKKLICFSRDQIIQTLMPKGQLMSRDARAVTAGIQCPPHLAIQAYAIAAAGPFKHILELLGIIKLLSSHILRSESVSQTRIVKGNRVFIGHGKSRQWKDLKDFIQDRLQLPWDEFNRIPIAGITNIARLSEMLNTATVAFLVLTAENEKADGTLNPRMNVVHEAGLFQGKLGFEKAIILLEDGCEEFSNINGLGQIRYPANKIDSSFEQVRQILEREGLIK